jgi:hypothetical protein
VHDNAVDSLLQPGRVGAEDLAVSFTTRERSLYYYFTRLGVLLHLAAVYHSLEDEHGVNLYVQLLVLERLEEDERVSHKVLQKENTLIMRQKFLVSFVVPFLIVTANFEILIQ